MPLMNNSTEHWFQQGISALQAGHDADATAAFFNVLKQDATHIGALFHYAALAAKAGNRPIARALYEEVLKRQPQHAEAASNLSSLYMDAGEWENAEKLARQALHSSPRLAAAWSNLNRVLHLRQRYDEAVKCARKSVQYDNKNPAILVNAAACLTDAGELKEAATLLKQALRQQNDSRTAYALSTVLMKQQHWREALPYWQQRWLCDVHNSPWRDFPQAQWTGDNAQLSGKTLLVWGEQGIGDELLALGSHLDTLLHMGIAVVVEAHARLIPLLQSTWPAIECVAAQNPPDPRLLTDDIGAQLPAGDLFGLLQGQRNTTDTATRTALTSNLEHVQQLRQHYQQNATGKRLIGIAWKSSNQRSADSKSLSLAELIALPALHNSILVCLQHGAVDDDIKTAAEKTGIHIVHDKTIDPMASDIRPYVDQIAAMDMIVSSSNTAVHIAGALHKPTWLLLPKGPGLFWYWGEKGQHCPWYPSVTLIRSEQPCEWAAPLQELNRQLSP